MAAVKPYSSDQLSDFVLDAQLILDIFNVNFYALNCRIEPIAFALKGKDANSLSNKQSLSAEVEVGPRLLVKISLQAPANLWSQQVLTARGDLPRNDFEIKVS